MYINEITREECEKILKDIYERENDRSIFRMKNELSYDINETDKYATGFYHWNEHILPNRLDYDRIKFFHFQGVSAFGGKEDIVCAIGAIDDEEGLNKYIINLYGNKKSVLDFNNCFKFEIIKDTLKISGYETVLFDNPEKKKSDILTGSYSITVTDTDTIYRIHSITEDVKRTIQCYLNNWSKDDRSDAAFNIRILDENKNLYMLFLICFTKGIKRARLFIQTNFDNGELININKTDIDTIKMKFENWVNIKSLDHAFRKIVFNIFEKRSKMNCSIERSNLPGVIFYDVPMFLFNNYNSHKDEQEDSVYHIKAIYYDHAAYHDHIFIELGADGRYYLIIFRDEEDVYYHLWFSDYIYLVRNIETVLDVKLFEKVRGIGR